MKKIAMIFIGVAISLLSFSQQIVEWVSTTQKDKWITEKELTSASKEAGASIEIKPGKTLQTIKGFGTCFNELGWISLSRLGSAEREGIMKELFAPGVGANFTICRMPVGANDFSKDWYSYDETDGDFDMQHFSISHDLATLVPFIKNAKKYNASLQLWASPWSPPTWMKRNKHYAMAMGIPQFHVENGLKPEQVGKEGTDMFMQEEKYLKAYALYFSKFINAYKQQGINIGMVMPQNEFNSAQMFPSCTWTAGGLNNFLHYLVPQMKQQNVDVFFGTMERANETLVDTILNDPKTGKSISGVGFQWAGKGAIGGIHKRYPGLQLYQSEQECGDGKNDWKYCVYTWTLMKHYLTNGASAYMYWNTSLDQGGVSRWGWRQNSLVSVDTVKKTFAYNYEYYLMKHLSHYVKPGAQLLETSGDFTNTLAFLNPDKSIVIVAQNDSQEAKTIHIKVNDKTISPLLKADSFNTFLIKN